eukprot:TRINITY_DN2545_c0_g1_i1.p1 TRINITY_DN2545_c0_g1~~TRINITY_DN2545_c0_g1_i1.p1  ORF type:complete len:377 (+),score=10.95 TRINITY_DN2545_c0_g1_i1:555-1685(+)
MLVHESLWEDQMIDLFPAAIRCGPSALDPHIFIRFLKRSHQERVSSPPELHVLGNTVAPVFNQVTDVTTQVLASSSLESAMSQHIQNITQTIKSSLTLDRRSALLHFLPELSPNCTIGIVPILYPQMDDATQERIFRSRMQKKFGLPLNYPRFLPSLHVPCCVPRNSLDNLHMMLPPLQDFLVCRVQGPFTYHHYGCGVNDIGWGCAYRSLQTIASWLIGQGVVSGSVPSHLEIQQTLIQAKDKPNNFLNSTQWIGAVEVGLFLHFRYSVEYKLLSVRSGDQIDTVVPDLIAHFSGGGAPVMIGGGVLAYTLLGVAIPLGSMDVTKAQFLILDPHYVGPSDTRTIISQGWFGWRNRAIFHSDAFYNFCVPLIPSRV